MSLDPASGELGAPSRSEAFATDAKVLEPLKQYLGRACPPLLDSDSSSFNAALNKPETEDILKIFASDSSCFTLVIYKRSNRVGEEGKDAGHYFSFELQVKPASSAKTSEAGAIGHVVRSVAVLRLQPSIEPEQPVAQQLQMCQIDVDGENGLDGLLSLIRHWYHPYSRALLVQAMEDPDRKDTEIGVLRGVSSKLSELEVELLRSQQSMDIPHITLELHNTIAQFVKQQRALGKSPTVEDLGSVASDPNFLNEIQKGLTEWKTAILRITSKTRDVTSGTVLQEINFWLSMERAIAHIYEQKESPGVALSFQILKENKRFLATTGFMQDAGLSEEGREKDKVYRYSNFLRDFPVKRLLAASTVGELSVAVEAIFKHMTLVKRREVYSLSRAAQLMHTISRDVANQLQSVLKSRKLMALEAPDFAELMNDTRHFFEDWDKAVNTFKEELDRAKRSMAASENIHFAARYEAMDGLMRRVDELARIRTQHEQLRSVVCSTLQNDAFTMSGAVAEIDAAYQLLVQVDVLCTSSEGGESFERALRSYTQRIDRVEAELEDLVRRLLSDARHDANEMFRVCDKFNALFVRPRIEAAIREYQEQLMMTVKKDIQALQNKFASQSSKLESHRMAKVRDFPPVSATIIWIRQIERQLATYMSRVEKVLGPKWHHHVQGQALQKESLKFKDKLASNSTRLFQDWLEANNNTQQLFNIESRIFKIVSHHKNLALEVNFDERMVTLFKEVRNLSRLGFKSLIHYELKVYADDARQKYPFAMRLEEAIRMYHRTSARLDEHKSLVPLGAIYKRKVQETIKTGMGLQWDTDKLANYVVKLGMETTEYQDQVDELISYADRVSSALSKLKTCKPNHTAFKLILGDIQGVIDHLDKRGYSNLRQWVDGLDGEVESVLLQRLARIVTQWIQALDMDRPHRASTSEEEQKEESKQPPSPSSSSTSSASSSSSASAASGSDEADGDVADFVIKEPLRHEILTRNQVLCLEPSLEMARLRIAAELSAWLSVICELPRLRCFWAEEDAKQESQKGEASFKNTVNKLPTQLLKQVLEAVEEKVSSAERYVATWLGYQALWDMDIEMVLQELGTDLKKWERLLLDMKRARATFDNADTERRFGPILIEYGTVQARVNDKYDAWFKLILARFGAILGELMSQLHSTLGRARGQLESYSFEFGSTSEIVESVSLLQELRKKAAIWHSDLESQKKAEQLLQRQRFLFPSIWLEADRVQGEWASFEQILSRKVAKLTEHTSAIQAKIAAEDMSLDAKVKEFASEWKRNRPIQGDLDHKAASNALSLFDTSLTRLEEEAARIVLAKRAMDMAVKEEYRLQPVREELQGLKEVWDQLSVHWRTLDHVGDKFLRDMVGDDGPTELRKKLMALQSDVQKMPTHMRGYEAYEHLRSVIRECIGLIPNITELSSSVLRPKHQKQILQELRCTVPWRDLTVATVWKLPLKAQAKNISYILQQAQGEAVLEDALSTFALQWDKTQFDMVDYRGKCFLVRNWDALFAQIADNLSTISSMKNSPFYGAFERDAALWEAKLNQAQAILDVFIDVQRRWVYLEGIFTNSQDVQVQLAYQYKRFKTFDRDFVRLMRDMKKDSALDYWVKEERGLLATMESHLETLNNIQKALGDYLEKQRAAFPRFYFVGDEDLLEIIGNAKDPVKVIRHLSKMFAGLESIGFNADKTKIVSMLSKEGEEVIFKQPIDLAQHNTIHGWLNQLEYQMRASLAYLLEQAMQQSSSLVRADKPTHVDGEAFFRWVDQFPAQIALLATQVIWSQAVDAALAQVDFPAQGHVLDATLERVDHTLQVLADRVLVSGLQSDQRKKYEQLVTELVHQRDVLRALIRDNVRSASNFQWLAQMRFYFTPTSQQGNQVAVGDESAFQQLEIRISRASFYYGFEYLGVGERLVQTPLTDRAYLTLTEALHMRLGGNPFGPAGTGKTETVKALGSALGRFVLVFNCDETFDFQAMGRIFIGLCQCGAWGCFDEFNRLEERILSAVSQQILTIQTGLKQHQDIIPLLGKQVRLNHRMGVFVTMNPGYAGRSNLPDNLKQLFRGMAMIQPNRALICEVMLYSQGFRTAEQLAGKIVMLFSLCQEQLSSQSHYDFGLRALKSVLRSAGGLKRVTLGEEETAEGKLERKMKEREEEKTKRRFDELADEKEEKGEEKALQPKDKDDIDWFNLEQELLVKSMSHTIVPKLVSDDVSLFTTLLKAVFPKATVAAPYVDSLRAAVRQVCRDHMLLDEQSWVDKVMQLYQIQSIHHGVITVGPSGTGKSTARRVLREALEIVEETKIDEYVIDPKALSKDELYGTMDPTTLEWTNGVFTHILRKILDNVRGEQSRRHWIIFDGDVDPEWAENLNSVLDDNKLLTLPNGERLALTNNIRILFEVQNLNHATPATVSRCGMVWFSESVVSVHMLLSHHMAKLRSLPITSISLQASVYNRWKHVQAQCVDILVPYFGLDPNNQKGDNFVYRALDWVMRQPHIMDFAAPRVLAAMFSLLKGAIGKVMEYNDNHADFPLDGPTTESFVSKYMVFALLWSFGGSLSLKSRLAFCDELQAISPVSLPDPSQGPVLDFEVRVDSGKWEPWSDRVKGLELEPNKVNSSDVVIETVDTVRHTDVIGSWLGDHRPLILCGPPGSGKSMTLTSVLRSLPEVELVSLNFSSSTQPDLILRALNHYCKTERTPHGLVMRPVSNSKWLVIFCDEINLPATDAYKTQRVVTFLRQICEHGGFWRASDLSFITLERVLLVGACNPPTDPGRVPLSDRFMRHCPLLFVDFPAVPSLRQIYGTFNRAVLKLAPPLRHYWEPMTEAMIEAYTLSQQRFTADMQPHYIYSPRELSRWVRAMFEALKSAGDNVASMTVEDLVRLWLHEALRLFQDRLVEKSEREWTDVTFDTVAKKHFQSADHAEALARPVLFSNWIVKQYVSVDQETLRTYVKNRLRQFSEEQLDVKLVIFDEVLEHILRIDRVLRQPMGHLLLVGSSGAGKTILSKFVAWNCGMSVFQIKVHKFYSPADFDKDLRSVLLRAGCKGEKICFIFDESNVLGTAFLERMNALLAGGEVPGLFEGADYLSLIAECKEAARRDGQPADSEEELFRRFTAQVQMNLHVVFTMNPANDDFDNRSATSPALFNRCVIDWFGEWSSTALYQVGFEFTRNLDLNDAPEAKRHDDDDDDVPANTQREAVVRSLVYVHESVQKAMLQFAKQNSGRATYVTPRHYLDFIKHYSALFKEKREQLEEQQRHLNSGLKKLRETQEEVLKLKGALTVKNTELSRLRTQANAKLEEIMRDKKEAEQKKAASEQIAVEIKEQEENIHKRRVKVEDDLNHARPALEEAQSSVRNIKKADLDQVARFPNPPAAVKLALEPVILMLGEKISSWEDMKRILRRSDFIKSVIQYDVDQLPEKLRKLIAEKYLPDPSFSFEVVNNASKACGPLVSWVSSTINYARIKDSVAPLTQEMAELQDKQDVLKKKQEELAKIRAELDARIEQYMVEYSELIAEVERIKAEMSSVEKKVERSISLLHNLSSENERWENDSQHFQTQISTLVGDCLLAAAFLAYIGYFNQSYRQMLIETWQDRLRQSRLQTKPDLSLIEYLSHPSERLEWAANALPTDDLCIENAIMLNRFNRYPLMIDPSGQATEFVMKQYHSRKLIRTSFLDDAFLKNLESALRFGNALLVEDVESIDPVLNSVLNREVTKTGGRVLITLGDKELDFSPTFTIFLSTRDPTCHFTPDLCSRVTFVNFTVTPGSLTSQCLNKVLKSERPDVDAKRSDLLRQQGEFRVRLRSLEDSLLSSLSAVKGNILDDEAVMSSLETLKKEAADITTKMNASEQVMNEVHRVSAQYRPFASACSSIYFSLENLSDVHFLYQFSLPFFMTVVDHILHPGTLPSLASIKDPQQRLRLLTSALFSTSFQRVSRGMMNRDQMAFALRLAQVALSEAGFVEQADDLMVGQADLALDSTELEFFIKGKLPASVSASGSTSVASASSASLPASLPLLKLQREQLTDLCSLPSFHRLASHMSEHAEEWKRWLDENQGLDALMAREAEQKEFSDRLTPSGWEKEKKLDLSLAPSASPSPSSTTQRLAHLYRLFHQLMVLKVIRPDLVASAAAWFVAAVFGPSFLPLAQQVDLSHMTLRELSGRTPLLLVSKPGFDASGRVDALAGAQKDLHSYQSFAMGSPEGYDLADAAINQAAKNGSWVLLKNVHLSPNWLSKLEKRLHRLSPHPHFRLFLTMELHPKVPVSLLRLCSIVLFEPPMGIKSSLQRMFRALSPERVNRAPAERGRLYFLLAWLHAVILERLRYCPVGWSKEFEFSETDAQVAMDAVDEWISKIAQDRANLPPSKIPWDALQSLLETIVYGGRLDNDFDQSRLSAFVRSLFTEDSYRLNFPLATSYDQAPDGSTHAQALLTMPECGNYEGFAQWIDNMPDIQSPEVLGLPSNAELMLLIAQGHHMTTELGQLQSHAADADQAVSLDDDDDDAMVSSGSDETKRAAWMNALEASLPAWIAKLPALNALKAPPRGNELDKLTENPIFRCIQREFQIWTKLHRSVLEDLNAMKAVLSGADKASNHIRELFGALRKDKVPPTWQRGGAPIADLTPSVWLEDLGRRVVQIQKLISTAPDQYHKLPIWLGGLHSPEAFVAAARQAVAKAHGWSLEQVMLQVTVVEQGGAVPVNPDSLTFEGLKLHGAIWRDEQLAISNSQSSCMLHRTHFSWVKQDEGQGQASSDESGNGNGVVHVPLYLDGSRRVFVMSVGLKRPESIARAVWSQRGTCVTVWNSLEA